MPERTRSCPLLEGAQPRARLRSCARPTLAGASLPGEGLRRPSGAAADLVRRARRVDEEARELGVAAGAGVELEAVVGLRVAAAAGVREEGVVVGQAVHVGGRGVVEGRRAGE